MNQLPESNSLLFGGIALAAIVGWAVIEGMLWGGSHITVGWS